MVLVKPLVRSITGLFSVAVGLYGLTIDPDLMWFCVAMAVVGALNLIVGVLDERDARKRSDKLEEMVQESRDFVRTLAGPMEVPAHLQDLTRLSNRQIKALIEATSIKLREFQERINGEKRNVYSALADASQSPEEQLEKFQARVENASTQSDQQQGDFLKNYRPQALALRDEMARRLPNVPGYYPKALDRGTLLGPQPVEEVATELERLSRLLPDD